MNELEQALAILRERGATEADVAEYTRQFMTQMGSRPDATSALQRERPDASGDWEAIPDGLKTAAGIGLSMIPAERGLGIAMKGAARLAPTAGRVGKAAVAFAEKVPVVNAAVRAPRAALRAWRAGKAVEKAMPKSLDDILGNMELVPEEAVAAAPARTIEEAVGIKDVVRNASPVKQRGATKARFDWFAEQQAKKAAERAATEAAPAIEEIPLEELLRLNLEHVKKGGSMKSASDALRLVRRQ